MLEKELELMIELLIINLFILLNKKNCYILYLVEYVIKSIILFCHAYRDISFEQEAYYHEEDMEYLKNRKHHAWIKYLFKTYKRK